MPSIAYGIKAYRGKTFVILGNDKLITESFEINRISATSSTFSVRVVILGSYTIVLRLDVAYIAIDPNFPHHLNSFDNVPLNYTSGNIVLHS